MYPSTRFDRFERAQLPLLYGERAPEFDLSIFYLLTEYLSYEINKKGVWFYPIDCQKTICFSWRIQKKKL